MSINTFNGFIWGQMFPAVLPERKTRSLVVKLQQSSHQRREAWPPFSPPASCLLSRQLVGYHLAAPKLQSSRHNLGRTYESLLYFLLPCTKIFPRPQVFQSVVHSLFMSAHIVHYEITARRQELYRKGGNHLDISIPHRSQVFISCTITVFQR